MSMLPLTGVCLRVVILVSLVIATATSAAKTHGNSSSSKKPKLINELVHIRSDILYRLNAKEVTQVIRNTDSQAHDYVWSAVTGAQDVAKAFSVTTEDGKRHSAKVKSLSEARSEYIRTLRGRYHMKFNPLSIKYHDYILQFKLNISIPANKTITLTFETQEILYREKDAYLLYDFFPLDLPTKKLRYDVHIQETRRMGSILPMEIDLYPGDVKVPVDDKLGWRNISAIETIGEITANKQNKLEKARDGYVSFKYDLQYDPKFMGVSLEPDVITSNGYFVHYIRPDFLDQKPLKDIIFVLDVSSQMRGFKIKHLRRAMRKMLKKLGANDRFNIILYGTYVCGKTKLYKASSRSVKNAILRMKRVVARGLRNVNRALGKAVKILNNRRNTTRAGIIFFLNSGNPTIGEVEPRNVLRSVTKRNSKNAASIFTVGYGSHASDRFLGLLASQNNGFYRYISKRHGKASKISSIFDEITAVAVKNLKVSYSKRTVDLDSLTNTVVPTAVKGTDIIICGKLKENDAQSLKYTIKSGQERKPIFTKFHILNLLRRTSDKDLHSWGFKDVPNIAERIWALTTINQLLLKRRKSIYAKDRARVKALDSKLLNMSLKYQVATPVSSMSISIPGHSEAAMWQSNMDPWLESAALEGTDLIGIEPNYESPCKENIRGYKTNSSSGKRRHRRSPVLASVSFRASRSVDAEKFTSICVVPDKWHAGEILLFSKPNNFRLTLLMCTDCQEDPPPPRGLRYGNRTDDQVALIYFTGIKNWFGYVKQKHDNHDYILYQVHDKTQFRLHTQWLDIKIIRTFSRDDKKATYRIVLKLHTPFTKGYNGLLRSLSLQAKTNIESLSRISDGSVCTKQDVQYTLKVNGTTARKYALRPHPKKPSE